MEICVSLDFLFQKNGKASQWTQNMKRNKEKNLHSGKEKQNI